MSLAVCVCLCLYVCTRVDIESMVCICLFAFHVRTTNLNYPELIRLSGIIQKEMESIAMFVWCDSLEDNNCQCDSISDRGLAF